MDKNFNVLYKILKHYPKLFFILLIITEYKYKHLIYKKTGLSGSTVNEYIKYLSELGLIDVNTHGRINYLSYTKHGLNVVDSLFKINAFLEHSYSLRNQKVKQK